MKKTCNRILFGICCTLFILGIVIGMVSVRLCTWDNGDYQEKQPELFAPDEIATVLRDEGLRQIYVCYDDATYVNVYSEDGDFLWAISIPYLQNGMTYFELIGEELILYNHSGVYIYKSADGTFVKKTDTEERELSYDEAHESADDFEAGEFYFDTFQVYRAEADGTFTAVVARPWWYGIFHVSFFATLSVIGALGIGCLILFEKYKDYRNLKKEVAGSNRCSVVQNPKGRFILKYFQVTVAVHLIYAVLDILFGILLDGILCIGIMPLALHFIVSQVVILNMLDRLDLTEEEKCYLDSWTHFSWASFIVAFFSVIVAAMVA